MAKKELNLNFFGLLFSLGAILMVVSSAIWESLPQIFIHADDPKNNVSLGEWIYLWAQTLGVICFIACAVRLLRPIKFFWAVACFMMDLGILDLLSILFLNPFERHLSKSIGVMIAAMILLVRLKYYKKYA